MLNAPHHGSKTLSTVGFLQVVSPQISLFAADYLNRFGHPKPEIIERFHQQNSDVYRSDRYGAIIITFKQRKANNASIIPIIWRKT